MQNDERHINVEVERTLQMAAEVERVEGNPFFSTRVMQRLKNVESEKTDSNWVLLPSWRMVVVGVLMVANIVSMVRLQMTGKEEVDLVTVVDEYSLATEAWDYSDYLDAE